ncbi:MAG: MBL fold metallo-hydrolase [Spirochaetes bacterium]|nr:MAG: MBL fold metallo-hydrolase [Spirochaetota bacterium]
MREQLKAKTLDFMCGSPHSKIMKLTIIGSWGAYPGDGGATSGYLLQADGYNVLLDCGSGILSKLPRYLNINDLHSVVISHFHPDHVADAGVLKHAVIVQKALENRREKLLFYAPKVEPWFSELTHDGSTEGRPYSEDENYRIGPFVFTFKRAIHPVPAYSMRVECSGSSLGYTGDTSWSDNLSDFFGGVDLLLAEASLFNRFKGKVPGHMTSVEAAELASNASVKRLVVPHFPQFGKSEGLKQEAEGHFPGPVDLAIEGNAWEF